MAEGSNPSDGGSFHMTPDDFRRVGHRMIDFIADYMAGVERWPVSSADRPGDLLARLPEHPPEVGIAGAARGAQALNAGSVAPEDPPAPDSWDRVFDDLSRLILPGLMHWQHPSFFGYFPCNATGPAILGELLSAGLGVQGMLWRTSPACTELEMRMLDWMGELLGLPACFRSDAANPSPEGPLGGGGVIQGTASEAVLTSLVAAREKWRRWQTRGARRREALDAEIALASTSIETPFAVVCSEAAHSSVAKAAVIAGIAESPEDDEHVWTIPTDRSGGMDPRALRVRLERAGATPLAVVATLGTTAMGGVDSIPGVMGVLRDVGLHTGPEEPGPDSSARPIWLHVDAAWAGSALVCPEHRWMASGIEHADSLCVNPHKWLLTNFDCNLFWTRSRRDLVGSMSLNPEYLRNEASDAGRVIDYRDWHVPLGRRFRALKLWFVLRHYGAEGLRRHIRLHCRLAESFENRVRGDGRFELMRERSLALVCFRLRAGDAPTRELLERANATGRVFLSHAAEAGGGRAFIRMAIGGVATGREHVLEAWRLLQRTADEMGVR